MELWLWGIDKAANRILLVDRGFHAYFYVVLQDGADSTQVADAIQTDYAADVTSVEAVQRRFFGKPITALKVTCKNATKTSKLAKQLQKISGVAECLEDDIRAAMRYLLDHGLAPCSWLEAEVEEIENADDVRVAKVYRVISPPKLLDRVEAPDLRVLGFNMVCYSHEGSPKADRNPILLLSTAASNGETRQFTAPPNLDDKPLLEAFLQYIQAFDPDVIVSYGANTLDWAYLRGRCHRLGLHLNFDRAAQEPHTSVYGHVSVTGVVNVDLADFTELFPEVKVKTLWNFAENLGLTQEGEGYVEDVLFADYWDDPEKRGELERFASDSAQ